MGCLPQGRHAGVNILQYSDRANQLIVVVDDLEKGMAINAGQLSIVSDTTSLTR